MLHHLEDELIRVLWSNVVAMSRNIYGQTLYPQLVVAKFHKYVSNDDMAFCIPKIKGQPHRDLYHGNSDADHIIKINFRLT